ncbi:sodium-dependent transporter [Alkalibacterium pelagium]|uniref:Neurotransmitter:Na+ symporter, NSS family n=1 Tax=Alkalibacterium pelagium TaxID=426702 RepID=A0A1H7LZN7_9LACT|nr:sodium-dependent transporter [Alkalibacterium pelagium]GEN51003.1 transporter [Alkalibacterium pelagium]SEL03955.1 neurotransmitter:Na+ symporter, NSS family [Alkalibacterium pelagium]
MEQKREQWGSRWGFILATMGSAVGLGNIWRFSYAMGEGGGSAFLIIYLLSVLLLGFPVMLIEFSIGRRSQADAVQAFKKLAPKSPWFIAGGLGVLAAFLILSFYGVIGGWSLRYTFEYLTGGITGDSSEFFSGFIGSTVSPVVWQFVFMALTIGIVFIGVQKGIELSSKWMMPILSILVIILAAYSLTLGGTAEALNFMFRPEWSAFADPNIYLSAMGQAFFTLSLGMGIMLTYSSYLKPDARLTSSAAIIIVLDTVFAIISGLIIFPALFAFGLDPAEGAGLVFIVLPNIFEALGGIGTIVGLVFFILFSLAALSSAISLLEVSVSYFMRRLNMSRKAVTLIVGLVISLLGVLSSLSQGAMEITIMGDSFLDFIDGFTGNLLLPLSALISVLFVSWTWKKEDILTHTDTSGTAWSGLFIFTVKFIAPIAILVVLIIGILNW